MRGPRICYPHAILHVINRFVDRHPFFKSPGDYELFLDVYFEEAKSFGLWTYAYCLMPNHFHIVLEAPHGEISRFLQRFLTRVAKTMNRRRGRVGHLFQGRTKTLVVQSDAYLMTVIGYVLMNPVRAGICKSVCSYRWSSAREMLKSRNSRIAQAALWPYLFDRPFNERTPEASLGTGRRWLASLRSDDISQTFEQGHRGGFLSDDKFRQTVLDRVERRKSEKGGRARRKGDRHRIRWEWNDMLKAARLVVDRTKGCPEGWHNKEQVVRHILWYLAHAGARMTWDEIRRCEGDDSAPLSRFSVAKMRLRQHPHKMKLVAAAIKMMSDYSNVAM